MYNIKKPTLIITDMDPSIIELDNSDQMLIYRQNLQQKNSKANLQTKQSFPLITFREPSSQIQRMDEKLRKGPIQLPNKFVLRPILLNYIDRIQQLYLQQKDPYQIQIILKQPTLVQIQCILKQKIHTFLNIIFQSSHCFTEDQVQKIRPQINQKIERISLEMLDPFRNNFIDATRYQNFLKLMKCHKEGRRSQKISKKCNTFFRLFFFKMRFQGISHTQGNVIELNESKNKIKDSFQDEKNSSNQSQSQKGKSKKNNKPSSKKDQLYGSTSSNKKYFYGRQTVISQKIMDEARQSLLKQIRGKAIQLHSQKQNPNKQTTQKSDKNLSKKKSQNSTNKVQIEIDEEDDTFQWTFDKQNTFLFILFESHFKKQKTSKILRTINEKFLKKYEKVRKQPLTIDQIFSKLQSMFSISCQKFIRRIKYLTIKQGLQNNPNLNSNQNKNQNSTVKSSKKKKVYSIMEIQKNIQMQNDQKNLSKQDEFYFSKLKQHLKALQVKQVYLSSSVNSPCQQEWSFMLDFLREFYFSVLEDFKFDYLLQYAKRVIQMNTIERKLGQAPIALQQDQDDQQEAPLQVERKKQDDCQKDLMERLPKSSFCFTLSKMGKSKPQAPIDNSNNIQRNQQNQQGQINSMEFVSIDEILRKSTKQNLKPQTIEIDDKDVMNKKNKQKQSFKQVKIEDVQKSKLSNHNTKQKSLNIHPKIVPSENNHKKSSNQPKVKQLKRVHPQIQIQQDQVKEQSDLKTNGTAKRTGEPMKKIKQNQIIQHCNQKQVRKITLEDSQQKIEFESDDQFQQILQLSSSLEEKFLQEESPKNYRQAQQQLREQKQFRNGKSSQRQNRFSQKSSQSTTKKTISVKPRGPRYTYQDEDIIQNQQIEDLIRQIQVEEQQNQQDDQEKSSHPDLSTIVQQDQEDGSQNISNSRDVDKLKSLLGVQDQYSFYQTDFQKRKYPKSSFISEKTNRNIENTGNFQKFYNQKNKNIQQKLHPIKGSNPSLSLEIIRKELQKIKLMGNQPFQPLKRLHSSQNLTNSSQEKSKNINKYFPNQQKDISK